MCRRIFALSKQRNNDNNKVVIMDKKVNKSELSFCELVSSRIEGLKEMANQRRGAGFLTVACEDLGANGLAVGGAIGGGNDAGMALAFALSKSEEGQVLMAAAFISWLGFVEPLYAIEVAKMVSEKAREISAKAMAETKK